MQRVVVSGPPWNRQLAAHVHIHGSVDGQPYENQFAHFLRLRWAKVVEDLVLEDTQQWERACRRLVAAGLEEAGAAPLGTLKVSVPEARINGQGVMWILRPIPWRNSASRRGSARVGSGR